MQSIGLGKASVKKGEKMKTIILILILVSIASQAFAYDNPFETTEHYKQRRASERYQANENNSHPFYRA